LFWRKYFGFCKGFFGFLPFLTFWYHLLPSRRLKKWRHLF
jgi:hypothetical protein